MGGDGIALGSAALRPLTRIRQVRSVAEDQHPMPWSGSVKTIVDLDGPDSPGAQAAGLAVTPGAGSTGTTTLSLSAAGGAQAIPNAPAARPQVAGAWFLATPAGNQASASTFTLPIGIAIYLFEAVLIAGLQAFIFAILTAIYLGGATRSH